MSTLNTDDDIFIISTLDGKIVHANKAAVEKLEYSLEELETMYIIELHPVEQREATAIIELAKSVEEQLEKLTPLRYIGTLRGRRSLCKRPMGGFWMKYT